MNPSSPFVPRPATASTGSAARPSGARSTVAAPADVKAFSQALAGARGADAASAVGPVMATPYLLVLSALGVQFSALCGHAEALAGESPPDDAPTPAPGAPAATAGRPHMAEAPVPADPASLPGLQTAGPGPRAGGASLEHDDPRPPADRLDELVDQLTQCIALYHDSQNQRWSVQMQVAEHIAPGTHIRVAGDANQRVDVDIRCQRPEVYHRLQNEQARLVDALVGVTGMPPRVEIQLSL